MEDRRFLLALMLSLLVLMASPLLFAPNPAKRQSAPSPTSQETPTDSAAPALATPPRPRATPTAPSNPVPAVSDAQERRIEVSTPTVSLAFTNRGARLLSWRLKDYPDNQGRPAEMARTLPGEPRALDVLTADKDLNARLDNALFKASTENLLVGGDGREADLVFQYADNDLVASKRIHFNGGSYLVQLSASVEWRGEKQPARVIWGPGLGVPSEAEMAVRDYQEPSAVYLDGRGVQRVAAASAPLSPAGPKVLEAVRWAGLESRYFAALFVVPGGVSAAETWGIDVPTQAGKKGAHAVIAALPVQGPLLLFVGPKDYQLLSKLNHDLQSVVPIGDWIGPIVVPLMRLLRWMNGGVGNYGWSIVLATALISLVMAPLRHYGFANGIRMAKLAPEMKAIQERYRKVPVLERQEMQQEIAALYARHGMNMGTQMAVGCFPMLLTMPFLFAIYRVLQISIDLRGAPFLWIADLSQKDPLYVTPVLMAVSMFVTQRMTPTSMDPAQQRMMMLMPVMLFAFLSQAAAGLNLYWLVSNVCSIIQQGITLRLMRVGSNRSDKKTKKGQH